MDAEEIKNLVRGTMKEAMTEFTAQMIQTAQKSAANDIEGRIKRRVEGLVDEASQEAAKRIKADITPTFKNPGNKDQFEHEQEMKGVMEEALKAIEGNDLEKAKSKLEDGKRFIASRIKLIKMADREEDGWDVVKFYKADDLADNSEDEKNISKAKRLAAVAKKKKNFGQEYAILFHGQNVLTV